MAELETDEDVMARMMVPRDTRNVRFFFDVQEDEQASKKAGRKIFKDVERVEIRTPGDRDFICEDVNDGHRQMFAAQYEAFRKKESQEAVSGYALSQWAQMRRAQVEEARMLGVHTVEQLAAVPDALLQRFGVGWIELRQFARDWVARAKDGAETVRLRSEVEDLRTKVKTLESMLTRQAQELHRDMTVPASVQYVTASPADDKIAKLEAKLADMKANALTMDKLEAMYKETAERLKAEDEAFRSKIEVLPDNSVPPKRRGRPPGSKNKPKNGTEAKPE